VSVPGESSLEMVTSAPELLAIPPISIAPYVYKSGEITLAFMTASYLYTSIVRERDKFSSFSPRKGNYRGYEIQA
jgi:hypothetical protein